MHLLEIYKRYEHTHNSPTLKKSKTRNLFNQSRCNITAKKGSRGSREIQRANDEVNCS